MDDRVNKGICELQPGNLGFAGVHVALLHTGQVLFFSYDDNGHEDTINRGLWQLWTPGSGPLPSESLVHNRNLFCSGHCILPDGRLLVAGGQSYNHFPFWGEGADHDLHTFTPAPAGWTRHANMPGARWYPTCVTLPDGNALIAGGHAVRYRPIGANNDEYEIFNWRNNSKSQPLRFNPGHIRDGAYPFMQVLPNGFPGGLLFVYCQNEARLFNLQTLTWDPTSFKTKSSFSRTYNHQGSCVLLPLLPTEPNRVRVMMIGGEGADGLATNTAEIFDFNAEVSLQLGFRDPRGGHMTHRRFMSDATLLPDGTVLIINGAGSGVADHSHDPVMQAELFDPVTESFSGMASLNRARLYHSSAILLPDARVLVSGNTRHWNPSNEIEDLTVEIFSPPYLFRGARPFISSAPEKMFYQQQYTISTPNSADIKSVVLIRPSSTTHTNNMDQRHIGLPIINRMVAEQPVAPGGPSGVIVTAPPNGTVAAPGFYMLFLVNNLGIPSVAKFVHLSVPPPPEPALLAVDVEPYPVPLGQPVQVTVFAADARAQNAVSGTVYIDGRLVGTTGVPFTYTFRVRWLGRPPEEVYPSGLVKAPGYYPAMIDFGL